jgi:sortase A
MSAVPLPLEPTSRRSPCVHPSAAAVVSVLLGLAGFALVGQGLWIRAKAVLAQVLLERAFVATLATGRIVKPWPWADTWPVARIEVPRLGKRAIVLHGSSGQALAFGPGHLEGTHDAGERGIAVYAAHRDTHFAFLGDVQIGDAIRVSRSDGATFQFRVTRTSVVRWDSSDIDPDADGRALVLSTCWPLDGKSSGPLRYLVHAEIEDAVETPR